MLGAPYEANGTWYYPDDLLDLNQTGIAAVDPQTTGLTADGEARDPTLATAAMQTVPLPVIAEITNLQNGRQIELRVNDRGPASPARLIALNPRAALLLEVPATGAMVRVRIEPAASRRLLDSLGGIGTLPITAAPVGTVQAETLPALPGQATGQAANGAAAGTPVVRTTALAGPAQTGTAAAPPPARLPERILLYPVHPGQIWLRAGSFGRFTYANARAARLSGLGGEVLTSHEGRQTRYDVRAGPFAGIAQADAALQQAIALGIPDARLTVE